MILMTVYVKVAPEKRQDGIETLKSMIGPVSVLPGCQGCYLYNDIDNDDRLFLLEQWESQKRFEDHVSSPYFRYILGVLELACEPPEILIHTVSSTQGMELIERLLRCDSGD